MALPYPNLSFVPLDVLTADEMNQIVANIKSLVPTELFNSQTGQGLGNFTLSDSIENYDTIEIYFRNGDNIFGSTKVKVYSSTLSTTLQMILPGGGTDQAFYITASQVNFAGTNANHYACRGGYFNKYNQMSVSENIDGLKIYKVVGYK